METLEGMAEEDVANVLSGLPPHQAAAVLVQVSPPARMCPHVFKSGRIWWFKSRIELEAGT